jgi:hypothetical protein
LRRLERMLIFNVRVRIILSLFMKDMQRRRCDEDKRA